MVGQLSLLNRRPGSYRVTQRYYFWGPDDKAGGPDDTAEGTQQQSLGTDVTPGGWEDDRAQGTHNGAEGERQLVPADAGGLQVVVGDPKERGPAVLQYRLYAQSAGVVQCAGGLVQQYNRRAQRQADR